MIKRDLQAKIEKWLGKEKILIIRGARQVGKSTLCKKLQEQLKDQGQNTFYFSMDRYDHLELARDPFRFFEYLKDKGLDTKQKNYLFLDEFQYIEESGRFLKILFDEHKKYLQIIATGSSSLEITKNSEFLTGRKIDFHLGTVSFKEYFQHKELRDDFQLIDIEDKERLESFYHNHKQKLEFHFFEYIKFGGYPEVLLEELNEHKKEIIKEITNTYLQKDVATFLDVQNVIAFNDLIQLLSAQIANLMNKTELGNTLKLSQGTLDRYLNILEGTYVFDFVRPFHSNVRKTLTKTPKVFIKDFGLQKVSLNYFPQDPKLISGAEVENFVYKFLREKHVDSEINFYRTQAGSEIDFLYTTEKGLNALEVKYSTMESFKLPLAIRRLAEEQQFAKKIVCSKDFLYCDYANEEYCIPVALLAFLRSH